jgi:glycogen synthase
MNSNEGLTIAFVTPEYPPDPYSSGLATYTCTMAESLVARGHRVHVVSRGREGVPAAALQNGVNVHRVWPARPELPSFLTPSATTLLALRGIPAEWRYRRHVADTLDHLVRNHGVQVIEAVDMDAEAAFYDPKRHPSVPFVIRLHTPTAVGELFDRNLPEPARKIVREIERRHILRGTHVVGITDRATRRILDHMGIHGARVPSIPNPPSVDPDQVEAALGDDGETVLFVGRVNRWKGAHLLMQAVPGVLRRRPRTQFVLAGEVRFMAARGVSMHTYLLGLVPPEHHHAITFLGRVPHDELDHHYRSAAVCAFPSLFETFGYTCVEAMAFGKAIVASDSGGMADLLDGGTCGLLFTPPNVGDLVDRLLTLLEDPGRRRELGRRARERVRNHYGRDNVLGRFESFYRSAIADRGSDLPRRGARLGPRRPAPSPTSKSPASTSTSPG